jgi:TetR/AcrR family transcriptional repressor of bet genes
VEKGRARLKTEGPHEIAQEQAAKPRKERKENADMRRRQLLDAARRSVIQHGLTRTTLATVAAEAGLSQGVAVFYFKSKGGLLVETLRAQYQSYADTWQAALAGAPEEPEPRLRALVAADFAPHVCDADALALWFAFWGEQKFTPQYADISAEFDAGRNAEIRALCRTLFSGVPQDQAHRIAEWIDTLTDGYWQNLHLHPQKFDAETGLARTYAFIDDMIRLYA